MKSAAEAVATVATAAGAHVTIEEGVEAQSEDLLECDAVALGSYDAFSYMGGGLKVFLFFSVVCFRTENDVQVLSEDRI